LLAVTLSALIGTALTPALAADPIKIGVPIGLSGANSVVAPSVVQSAQLAVDEINAAGGVLGRQLALVVVDDQSGAAGAQNAFDTLIYQKKVDVLISMETSAARNAALPIVAKGKTPYIYTSYYEGHSCSPYMYADSWVPEQQVAPVLDLFLGEKKAKTFFLIGSDYAYGRGMLGFSKAYILKKGGSVVGEEYNPMDASDWTSIISKVRAAKPDALILATAGGAPNVTLTKQYKAAGIQALIGNIGVDEGTAKSMGSDAAGIYISQAYVSSLDTPANAKYLAAIKAKFGDGLKTPNDLSVPEYEAIYLYKAAVEMAGSTKADDVLKALGSVSFEGPRGLIKMDKQRHAALTMNLGQVQDDGSVKVVKSFPDTSPGEQCPSL
jgi:branched-chain amino acid transport system substrate-binding protein